MDAVRWLLLAGAVLGAIGVALGAFGAHALAGRVGPAWGTAVQYHLVHAVALVALAGVAGRYPPALIAWAGVAFVLGIVLFSGSLYALSLGGPRALGPVTPLGGASLIAGWVLVALAALRG